MWRNALTQYFGRGPRVRILGTMIPTAQDILDGNGRKMISVSPGTTIYDTLTRMAACDIEAVLIEENDEFLGIWTARDLVRNSLTQDFDVKTARVGEYITTELPAVRHDTPVFKIADLLLGQRARCLLVKKKRRIIGLLTAGDVIQAALVAREEELRKLEGLALLECTDDWRVNRSSS